VPLCCALLLLLLLCRGDVHAACHTCVQGGQDSAAIHVLALCPCVVLQCYVHILMLQIYISSEALCCVHCAQLTRLCHVWLFISHTYHCQASKCVWDLYSKPTVENVSSVTHLLLPKPHVCFCQVSKRVWDFYTKLTVQQAMRVAGSAGGAQAALQQQQGQASGWMDPTSFR
jgi:hypothetical protein